MFIVIACTIGRFGESLASNSKRAIKCIPLNNRPCRPRPTLVDETLMKLFFIRLLLVLISVVEVIILLMIHMLEFISNKVKNMSAKNL